MLDILILGASGLLGKALVKDLAAFGLLHCPSHAELDVTDAAALAAYLSDLKPDVIVNAVAYNQVDAAEQFYDPNSATGSHTEQNPCWLLNALLPKQLAEYAAQHHSYLLHFSTDYVYGDEHVIDEATDMSAAPAAAAMGHAFRPRLESDPSEPLQYYGHSKLAGDNFVLASRCRAVIFRTSWLYGPWGKNFFTTLWRRYQQGEREFRVVTDQFGAPTSVLFLADQVAMVLEQLLKSSPEQARALSGIYHLCADDATSWYDFACAIFQQAFDYGMIAQLPTIHAIQSSQLALPAARPANSMLALGKIRLNFKLSISPWQIQLDETLQLMKMAG
jgi:dTDP-4-dehydrorhamnose reductase